MDTDEFSFPRISDTHAHTIDSPPLWNLSPAASPNPYRGNKGGGGEENDCFGAKLIGQAQRKSFSCVERKRVGVEDDDDEEDEDRMDMLWEDFNEELCSTTGSATSSSREVVEFRYAPTVAATTLAKANSRDNGTLVPTKNKPSMVVIVKVLKKLFSVNNSQRKPRRRVR